MTLGEKLKSLRKMKGLTQEELAEQLNVSRSAIAKWENDNGIPEICNLKLISQVYNISLDEILDNERCVNTLENEEKRGKFDNTNSGYKGWYCFIDLVGWNDGVNNALIISEDSDFLFYKKKEKRNVYGMIAKKYISTVEKKSRCNIMEEIEEIDRSYFCGKNVFIEVAHKEGMIKGFFDFTNDKYRDVFVNDFEGSKVLLNFDREIEIDYITKIEEL